MLVVTFSQLNNPLPSSQKQLFAIGMRGEQ
ncbi:Uncharacterised protein [Vibrio cholerae]|nr:Uncharacterised protein [Vibrio cholerae]CSI00177.1 Uncharacterised protein [Vibrio cholerae]